MIINYFSFSHALIVVIMKVFFLSCLFYFLSTCMLMLYLLHPLVLFLSKWPVQNLLLPPTCIYFQRRHSITFTRSVIDKFQLNHTCVSILHQELYYAVFIRYACLRFRCKQELCDISTIINKPEFDTDGGLCFVPMKTLGPRMNFRPVKRQTHIPHLNWNLLQTTETIAQILIYFYNHVCRRSTIVQYCSGSSIPPLFVGEKPTLENICRVYRSISGLVTSRYSFQSKD